MSSEGMRVALGLPHYRQMPMGTLGFGFHFQLSLLESSLGKALDFVSCPLWVLQGGFPHEAVLLGSVWDVPQVWGQPCPAPHCWG